MIASQENNRTVGSSAFAGHSPAEAQMSLRDLNRAGRRQYLALFFAQHLLGRERFERWLGEAKERNRARMLASLSESPQHNWRPVPEVTFRSHKEFYATDARPSEPAVFRGLAKDWPAVKKWNHEFFGRNYAGTKAALIDQEGLYSANESSRYEISTLGKVVEAMQSGQKESLRFSAIMDENPELKNDIDMDFCSGFRGPFSIRGFPQFFMAPAGTYTPVHCALESNVFIQVLGQKRWVLNSAMYQPLVDPPADRMPYFHTGYLPDRPSPSFPLGPYAPAFEVVLNPGDVMYIPPFVWHYVENLTPTIAVAYRFFSLRTAMRSSWPLTIAKFLSTKPTLFHSLVCPRRSLDRRCEVPGCPFALPQTGTEAG